MVSFTLALTCACSGDVFTSGSDAGDLPDTALDAAPDVRAFEKDAGSDASDALDGCTPFPPGSFFTCAQPMRHINVPYEYCSEYYGTVPTPPACWCQETYNCTCIAALYAPDANACSQQGFPPTGTPTCRGDGGALYVDCVP